MQINNPIGKSLLGLERKGNLISNPSEVYIEKAYSGIKTPPKSIQ